MPDTLYAWKQTQPVPVAACPSHGSANTKRCASIARRADKRRARFNWTKRGLSMLSRTEGKPPMPRLPGAGRLLRRAGNTQPSGLAPRKGVSGCASGGVPKKGSDYIASGSVDTARRSPTGYRLGYGPMLAVATLLSGWRSLLGTYWRGELHVIHADVPQRKSTMCCRSNWPHSSGCSTRWITT